jgi:hypothetical protein
MTVRRCHFAASVGYVPSAKLPHLGRIVTTVQWLNTTMPKVRLFVVVNVDGRAGFRLLLDRHRLGTTHID